MGFFSKAWNYLRRGRWEEPQRTKPQEIIEPPALPRTAEAPPSIDKERQQQLPTTKPVFTTPTTEEPDELTEAVKKINSKPSIKSIEAGINPNILTSTHVQGNLGDLNQYRGHYTKIFTDEAKITDPQIIDILIQNRDKLKNRFTAHFKIYASKGRQGEYAGGLAAELEVTGILLEHAGHIETFFPNGSHIEYVKERLDSAANSFRNTFGAININNSKDYSGNKPINVSHTEFDYTFA